MKLRLEEELNDKQCEAASLLDGPVIVIAGAGSGKTRMITYRIAHMLSSGINQSQILALTFTNKAAKEMSERIKELTGKKLTQLTSSTFHAFGVQILRTQIHLLGYDDNFTIYDQADKSSLIKHTIRELGVPLEKTDLFELSNLFSEIKTGRTTFAGYPKLYRDIYQEYLLNLKAYNAVDFDDLITMPTRIFTDFPKVLSHYQEKFTYIMVDEFQDTSLAQYKLVYMLSAHHRNICVVGDDDQSIYSWRGANYENLLNFERDFPEVTEIKLEQNYRSSGTILEAANNVIANNTKRKEKNLWTGSEQGSSITLNYPENDESEQEFITNTLRQICSREQVLFNDIGILVRTNTLIAGIEQHFLAENIPYTVSGGQSFFARKEIRDIISYLRLMTNTEDNVNFLRIINTPKRGIGRVSLEFLREYAKARGISLFTAVGQLPEDASIPGKSRLKEACRALHELIDTYRTRILHAKQKTQVLKDLVSEIEYRSHLIGEHPDQERLVTWKMKNVEIFISMFERWETDPDNLNVNLYDFLNRITLTTKNDTSSEKGKVNIMTIHASKGLEFHTVFLAGVEDHIIPHARSIAEDESNIEEERRLFYVALTRAQRHLFLTSCRERKVNREVLESLPSRFIEEIPEHLMSSTDIDEVVSTSDAADFFAQLKNRLSAE